MERRAVLRRLGAGLAVSSGGCLGGGGRVVVTVNEDVRIEPGRAYTKRIPDVSDPGGAIRYIVRAETPFDVYFFTDEAAFEQYDAYIKGREPERTPPGHAEFSQTALENDEGLYEATTDDAGREPLEAAGPYFFAVDHSNYRMETRVEEFDDPLTAFVDLTVVRKKTPF